MKVMHYEDFKSYMETAKNLYNTDTGAHFLYFGTNEAGQKFSAIHDECGSGEVVLVESRH